MEVHLYMVFMLYVKCYSINARCKLRMQNVIPKGSIKEIKQWNAIGQKRSLKCYINKCSIKKRGKDGNRKMIDGAIENK